MRSAKPAKAAKIGYLIMSGLLCLMGVLIIRYPEASRIYGTATPMPTSRHTSASDTGPECRERSMEYSTNSSHTVQNHTRQRACSDCILSFTFCISVTFLSAPPRRPTRDM